ncbi:MAG: efflux RND transporter periplasmic adaptor subunit [Desulfosudaceae bacterium]
MTFLPVRKRHLPGPPRRLWLAVLLGLCLLSTPVAAESDSSGGKESPCTPVELTRVQQVDMRRTINGIGTLEADQTALIKTEITGTIETVHFTEGAVVARGDKLIQINAAKLRSQRQAARAALKEARATLANAERTFQRQQELYRRNLTSRDARDEAETARETAAARVEGLTAELDLIEEDLADATITAPFAGVIGERLEDVGNWVNTGTPLTTLVKSDRLEIAFHLPERYLGDIEPGQQVRVITAARPDQSFGGKIFFISPQISESTRSILVKAGLDNSGGDLKPGGYASVTVTVAIHRDAAVIPEEALIPTRTGYKVFVVEDNVARLREVTPGLRQPGRVEITDGLEPGENVVRSGHINLHEGNRVCPAVSTNNPN